MARSVVALPCRDGQVLLTDQGCSGWRVDRLTAFVACALALVPGRRRHDCKSLALVLDDGDGTWPDASHLRGFDAVLAENEAPAGRAGADVVVLPPALWLANSGTLLPPPSAAPAAAACGAAVHEVVSSGWADWVRLSVVRVSARYGAEAWAAAAAGNLVVLADAHRHRSWLMSHLQPGRDLLVGDVRPCPVAGLQIAANGAAAATAITLAGCSRAAARRLDLCLRRHSSDASTHRDLRRHHRRRRRQRALSTSRADSKSCKWWRRGTVVHGRVWTAA